jgi:hypothetical protein
MADDAPEPDPDELVQMNVRVPRKLRDEIDERRGKLRLSRDKWVVRALGFALKAGAGPRPRGRTVARTPTGNTVKMRDPE